MVFQYVQTGCDDVSSMAELLRQVVDRWSELGAYFGTHRPAVVAEVRSHSTLESQLFDDALVLPRFAVVAFLYETC